MEPGDLTHCLRRAPILCQCPEQGTHWGALEANAEGVYSMPGTVVHANVDGFPDPHTDPDRRCCSCSHLMDAVTEAKEPVIIVHS